MQPKRDPSVQYVFSCWYVPGDLDIGDIDDRIANAAQLPSMGYSGFTVLNGTRDLHFGAPTEAAATDAAQRITATWLPVPVRCTVRPYVRYDAIPCTAQMIPGANGCP